MLSAPKAGALSMTPPKAGAKSRAAATLVLLSPVGACPEAQRGGETGWGSSVPHALGVRLEWFQTSCTSRSVIDLFSNLLEQREALEFIPHGAITLAGSILQLGAILNRDHTPRIVDQTCPVQESCRQGDGGARGTQHLTEKVMGQLQPVRFHSVSTGQQPAGKPLLNVVLPVAGSRLRGLHQKAVHPLPRRKRAKYV